MSMHVIREDAPGHDVTATDGGWQCVCGAGHEWSERPRTRAVAAGKRHLAAIARGDKPDKPAGDMPDMSSQAPEDPAPAKPATPVPDPFTDPTPDPAPWEGESAPEPPAPAPAPARPSLVDQFRSPPRDPE